MLTPVKLCELEAELLVEAIYRHYGLDFRDYSRASLRRRLLHHMLREGLDSLSALQAQVLHSADAMERLLSSLTVCVTGFFRDPEFYRALRLAVVPQLRERPFFRVWVAGCATGEESCSVSILLREEGVEQRRYRLYATDLNERYVHQARLATYPLKAVRSAAADYLASGGRRRLEDYFVVDEQNGVLLADLRQGVVVAQHDLTCGASFNEFHLILCRNVLIYFNRALQNRVHNLLYSSLAPGGVLALGRRESLDFTEFEDRYEPLAVGQKLYRRCG